MTNQNKQKTLSAENRFQEICLPFFDIHGDQLSVYIKTEKDQIRLSDDGYALNELRDQGLFPDPALQEQIRSICQENGFELSENEITGTCHPEELSRILPAFGRLLLNLTGQNMIRNLQKEG